MRRKAYPTDLTNEQWAILKPHLTKAGGRGTPRRVDLREIVNALLYLSRTGCQWRQLPHDLPPWQKVYYYFEQWRDDGTLERINDKLRTEIRLSVDKDAEPSAAIMDSQSVKTTETSGIRGYEAGKKVNGIKRHLLVDTLIQSRRWVWCVLALTLPLILLIGYQRLLDARPQLPQVTLTRGPYLQSVTPDGVTVVWETDLPGDSRVDYGPSTNPRFSVKSSKPVTRHVLSLTGLAPYSTVHYRVLTNRWPLWNEGTFRTAATPSQTVFSFAVFGDTRDNPIAHQKVVSSVLALAPDLVLHTGDYVDNGLVPQDWVTFFSVEQKLLSQIPLYGVMGNHETDSPYYFDAFYFPGNERWYSFDYGNVHFIALYAEKATPEEDPWLANDLAQTRQPWKVVFLHYPLYSSGHHGSDLVLRKQLEPVFIKYGVDLVFCGHDHDYERFVVNNIAYIVAGGGGAPLYQPEHPDPNSAYFTSTYSSVHIAVDGLQLKIAAVRSDGVQFDPFALRKASPADRAVVIR